MNKLNSIRDFATRNKSALIDAGIIVGTTIAGVSLSVVLSNVFSTSDDEDLTDTEIDTESDTSDNLDTND